MCYRHYVILRFWYGVAFAVEKKKKEMTSVPSRVRMQGANEEDDTRNEGRRVLYIQGILLTAGIYRRAK